VQLKYRRGHHEKLTVIAHRAGRALCRGVTSQVVKLLEGEVQNRKSIRQ